LCRGIIFFKKKKKIGYREKDVREADNPSRERMQTRELKVEATQIARPDNLERLRGPQELVRPTRSGEQFSIRRDGGERRLLLNKKIV